MKAVNNYLKNVMKSVTYAAADVSGDYMSNIKEFTSTNKEFATATYAALKNPAVFVRRQVSAIQESKIYKALDYGARNLVEDLRTGNFYNKEREERDTLALSGLDTNWDDLSEFGIDSDWEKKIDSSNDDITTGDVKIIESIEGSNAAVANATVNAVITSSQNEIKNSRANMAMVYTQNERLFGGLHKDITVIGSTMEQMYKLQSTSLQNIDKNMSNFFTQESKLSTERNAILKEMLEMQRNMYKSASDKEKEAGSKKKSNRIRWDDINVNGIPNLDAYFEAVKKNISSQISSLGLPGFGEDSNMLATFMTSPLSGAMKYVVNGIIPATVKAAAKELDSTISGVFGNIIGRLGNARSNNDDGILGTIAKFFGVSTNVNRNIDTSRYEKGPVPFDGITRRAIIDVIPTYLRRIEAAITGRPEEMFDYKNGRWVKVSGIEKQFKDLEKMYANRGTSELRDAMNPGLQAVRKGFNTKSGQEEWDEAVTEFFMFLSRNNGIFNSKLSADKNGIDRFKYPKAYKHYDKLKKIYDDFDLVVSKDKDGKEIRRHTKNSVRLRVSANTMDAKEAEEKLYREYELDPSNIFAMLATGGPKVDSHGKYVGKNKNDFKAFNILNNTKDDHGNTIFDYLLNINKELTYIRSNGVFGGSKGRGTGKRNEIVSMEQINNQLRKNKNDDYANKKSEDERIAKAALSAIASGKAVDIRDFDVDQQRYLLNLSSLLSENAITEYQSEIKGYNSNAISSFIDKHFIKTNIKSLKDVEKAIEKADKEGKNTNEVNMDAKEEKFFKKIMNRIAGGESILGGIVGASSEAFTNLLYTADKAIYEMMYKTEINDETKKKYKGFMDAMVGKMSDKFKDIGDQFKKDVIDPFKERLGIDKDFTGRFKDSLINTGSKLWTSFKDANASVYGPIAHEVQSILGLNNDETIFHKRRVAARSTIKSKVEKANSAKNLYDEEFLNILKEYGINPVEYDGIESAKADLFKALAEDMFKNSNNLQDTDIEVRDLKFMMDHVKDDKDIMGKIIRKNDIKIDDIEESDLPGYVKNKLIDRFYKTTSKERYKLIDKDKNPFGHGIYEYLSAADFTGDIDQKKSIFKEHAKRYGIETDVDRYKTVEELENGFLDLITKFNHAKGTPSGEPFSGITTLTKGEVLIPANAFGTVVPKTGVYNLSRKYHIINTEDAHDLGITNGPKVSIQQALGKEKLAARNAGFSIAHHDKGTINIKGKDLDTDEILSEAKKFIPEAASGGLIGGILSLVLGLAGGPILGAAVGAGGSIIANSDMLKSKLFGKTGEDGKNDGSGIISKTIMDKFHKYFPDMAKYGLAGIIPGLLTPLGPIGGLMVGGAFGYLKNNERFTNKYFGEEGALHIKSKEKKIIENLFSGAVKGAGVGVLSTLLLPTPFGILGNAAIGAGLGMMASTEEFKNFILGTEIDGERMGGIVGAFKDALEPFMESMRNAGSKLTDAIDKHIVKPLSNFINPAIHALPIALGALPKQLTKLMNKFFHEKIGRTIETRIATIFRSRPARAIGKVAKGVGKVATAPIWLPAWLGGKALNFTGDKLREFDIAHGDTVDMTQAEAVEWMKERGKGHKVDMLRTTSKIGTDIGMDVDSAKELRTALGLIDDTENSAQRKFNKRNAELNKLLTDYRTNDGKKLSKSQITKILSAANDGDFSSISDILQKRTLDGSSVGMTKAQFNDFMDGGLKKAVMNASEAKLRLDKIKEFGGDKDKAKAQVDDLMKELGIKGLDIKDKDSRALFRKLISERLIELEANPDQIQEKLETENNENIKRSADTLELILKILHGQFSEDSEDLKTARAEAKKYLELGQKNANKKYDKRFEKATKNLSEEERNEFKKTVQDMSKEEYEEFKKSDEYKEATKDMSEEEIKKFEKSYGVGTGADSLTTKKGEKFVNKYTSKIINIANSNFKNFNKVFRKPFRFAINKDIVERCTEDALSYISELTKYDASVVGKALRNKFIHKVIINGKYQITKDTIAMMQSSADNKRLAEICKLLDQIYNTKEGKGIYNRYDSLNDIAKIGLEERAKLVDEFNITDNSKTSSHLTNTMMGLRTIGRGVKKVAGTAFTGIGKGIGLLASTPFRALGFAGGLLKDKVFNHDIHSNKWHERHDKDKEQPETETNGIGTMLLNLGGSALKGLFNVGKNIVGKIGSGAKSLFNKEKDDSKKTGLLATILGAGKNLFNNHRGGSSGGMDEIDKAGDGRDVVHVGGGDFIQVERDSSGNIEPDTSDSGTKDVLNKLSLKEKLNEKFQAAQLKASELIHKTFDTSEVKESKGGKLGWFSLLLGGAVLWKSGILQKLFDGFIKPLWTNHIKPWIDDTAVPWITDMWTNKVEPFILDVVLPKAGELFGAAVTKIIENLPQILAGIGKGLFKVGDTATGNKYNAGGSTTVNISNLSKEYGSNYETEMYDESGNKLTVGDLKNGNFTKIYNSQGAEGTINENGIITFKDESLVGASYANTVINAGGHVLAKSMATGRNSLGLKAVTKSNNFLKKRGIFSKIAGYSGDILTKPVTGAENLGIKANTWIDSLVDKAADNILDRAIANGNGDEMLELLINGDGSKSSRAIQNIAEWLDPDALKKKISEKTNGKLFGKAASETVENAAEQSVKNAAKNTTKNSGMLTKIIAKAKEAIKGLFENSKVKKKLTEVAQALGQTKVGKWISSFQNAVDDIFAEAIEKVLAKVGIKAGKQVISKVLFIAFLIIDFVYGCDHAESILGVSETGIVEELVAGLINALCNFIIIPTLIPAGMIGSTEWIARKIYGFFDKSLEERQNEATEEYKKYVEETGSTLTKEEYLSRQYSVTGKIGGWFSDNITPIMSKGVLESGAISNTVVIDNLLTKATANSDSDFAKWYQNNRSTARDMIYQISNPLQNVWVPKLFGEDPKSFASTVDSMAAEGGSNSIGVKMQSIYSNADGTVSLSESETNSYLLKSIETVNGLLSNNILSDNLGIIGDITSGDINFKDLNSTMEAVKNGKISVFSKDYWKLSDNSDGTLKGTLEKSYTMLSKIVSLPMLMVKSSLEGLAADVEEVSSDVTGINSGTTTSTTSSTKSTIGSKIKGVFKSVVDKIKSFFGGSGTGNYRYGTGSYSKQIDPSVAGIRFNSSSDSEYQTIGDSGCGPAAAVNVLESMYGRGGALASAAKFALRRGYKETNGGTNPRFFTDYFNRNGLNSHTSYNKSEIERNINSGMPTVIMGHDAKGTSSSTPFGKTPHYVTITGTDGRGNAIVQDPESRYDNQLYPIKSLMKNTSLGVSAFGRGKWGRGEDYSGNIWWYLKQMGMTDAGAAGVLGNLYAESNLHPDIIEGDIPYSNRSVEYTAAVDSGKISEKEFVGDKNNSTNGYGLAGWTWYERKQELYNLAKRVNKTSIGDIGTALNLLDSELNSDKYGYKDSVLPVLKSTNSLKEASDIFMTKFENPYDQSSSAKSKRASYGQTYFDKYKNTSGEKLTGVNVINGRYTINNDANASNGDIFSIISDKLGGVLSNSKMGRALSEFSTGISNLSSIILGGTPNTTNSASASGDVARMIEIARKEVGVKEKGVNYVKYNDWFWGDGVGGSDYPWCAAFVSWVANQAGIPENIIPKTAGADTSYNDIINKMSGIPISNNKAQPGDLIYFDIDNVKDMDHIGIVTGNSNGEINTIEGNSHDMVAEGVYNTSSNNIFVVRPKYTNAGSVVNYTNTTTNAIDAPDISNTRGGNGIKPLSRYGQFKDSIYGTGSKFGRMQHKTKNGYVKIEKTVSDADMGNNTKSTRGKNAYSKSGFGTERGIIYGMGSPDYSKLINTIITILMSIADNTDKLNTIVTILNNKLNLNISASDVSNATTGKQSLKSKLSNALNNINSNMLGNMGDTGDSSINTIISTMNAIASE